ncbi:MAG: hypothetical protein CMF63_09340 [Magnetovibrio sp.]|nr:hypothetical protein [Magnetovibrio sp.]
MRGEIPTTIQLLDNIFANFSTASQYPLFVANNEKMEIANEFKNFNCFLQGNAIFDNGRDISGEAQGNEVCNIVSHFFE